ncbi:MAG TPA: tyrosine-type recombinase/integrase [Sphingomicrobium sp.]|nr:tyrosine-type recombinase/integrase [Sphingomicrobium sp.]
MPRDLITATSNTVSALRALADRARDYTAQAKSENTRRAYASDWRAFVHWCNQHKLCPMPAGAATLAAYLTAHAGILKVSTLTRRLSAVREAHRYAGFDIDTSSIAFRDLWRGIRRAHGAPARQKAPLLTSGLRKAIAALPDTILGRRDRALLLVGFAAALRRSELVTLEVRHREGALGWIEETAEGLKVNLARAKADQEGEGAAVGVPYGVNPETCPVRAYRDWVAVSGITDGPAFRSINRHGQMGAYALAGRSVARIVKRAIVAAGVAEGLSVEEAEVQAEQFAGHSLRAGLATSAAANDAPGHAIQRQLRHARFDTTIKYIRAGNLFKGNAAGMAGL